MKTLFPSDYNWSAYFVTGIILRLIFFEISWFSFAAVMISIYQFSLVFISVGKIIPTRHLLGAFMCVQFFLGPTFAYNGLEQYSYFMYLMRVPEQEYFAYLIPAVIVFILGLHLKGGKNKGEVVDIEGIANVVDRNPFLSYIFITLGFVSGFIAGFFSSELGFIFYILSSFKFIGLFLLVLGTKSIKLLPLIVVVGSIISSSLATGMFHDLLTWIVFTAAVFGIKYKFDFKIKLMGVCGFVFLALTIQLLKGSYRESITSASKDSGAGTFAKLYEEKNEGGDMFSFSSLAGTNTRINQGFIITNIMQTVPAKIPHADGEELYQILEAAILPRVFAPDKLRAGDRTIFTKYSGIPLQEGTSMGLSSVGDAYINFGIIGGIIFMFILGLFYSKVLTIFWNHSRKFPFLILFTTLVFYYPIRPDCEFQTILGHLFKSCFLIFVMMVVWRSSFEVRKKTLPPKRVEKSDFITAPLNDAMNTFAKKS